jgi:hypothetical protein
MFYGLPFWEWIFPCSADLAHGNKREKKCSSATLLRGGIARGQGGHYLWSFNKGLILSIHGKNLKMVPGVLKILKSL